MQEDITRGVAQCAGARGGASGRRAGGGAPDQEPRRLRRVPPGRAAVESGRRDRPAARSGTRSPPTRRRPRSIPGFALAWAQLSRARSTLYVNVVPVAGGRRGGPGGGRPRDRAGPGGAAGALRRALYLSAVRREHARALEEVARGRRIAPRDAELLTMAALAEQQLGRWDQALAHFRAGPVARPAIVRDPAAAGAGAALAPPLPRGARDGATRRSA